MNTSDAQNGQQSQSQPVTAPKKRKSRQSAVIQSAAIAKFSMNESKSQIAKDLGITRGTVYAILSQPEIEQVVLQGRSRAVSLIPKALDAVEYRLDKNDGNVGLGILRGTQVLVTQQVTQSTTNNFAFAIQQLKQSRENDSTLHNNAAGASTNPLLENTQVLDVQADT